MNQSALLALIAVACVVCACDSNRDGAAGGSDASGQDAAPGDAADAAPDAAEDTPVPDSDADLPDEDAGPECNPGERRCDGARHRLVCAPPGQWQQEACGAEERCEEPGVCVSRGCTIGDRICLDSTTPATCEDGTTWTPADPCEADEACADGVCLSRDCADAASSRSYLGCDYVASSLPNIAYGFGSTTDAPMGVVLANDNPDQAIRFSVRTPNGDLAQLIPEVTVEIPLVAAFYVNTPATVSSQVQDATGTVVQDRVTRADYLEIPPGGMAIALLPHRGAPERTLVGFNSFRIQTTGPVAAYQFGPYCCNYSFTNDASLLFPTPTLGTEYLYLGVPGWNFDDPNDPDAGSRIPANMTIIATRPATDVTITLPVGVDVQTDSGNRLSRQGQTLTTTLGEGEVLDLMTAFDRGGPPGPGPDMSGARISASEPISVFSGHLCTYVPEDTGACDHLQEQLFPIDTWGNEFALVPTKQRARSPNPREVVYWKILAKDDGTRISLSTPFASLAALPPGFRGVPDCADHLDGDAIRLDAGEFCEFGTGRALALRSSGPLMVMGIISGEGTTGHGQPGAHAGDPAIYLVPPTRQYRSAYSFLAPTTYFFDHVTVVTSPQASIELDGVAVDMGPAEAIPGSELIYLHLDIEDGPHRLRGSHPFGIVAYAFDDWVSYAFTGGLNLIKAPRD